MSIVNAFQNILNKFIRKPNKIWVDKGGEFYNNSFTKWLQDNDIAMYATHNEGKSVVAEIFTNIMYQYQKILYINTTIKCVEQLQ